VHLTKNVFVNGFYGDPKPFVTGMLGDQLVRFRAVREAADPLHVLQSAFGAKVLGLEDLPP
jgi:hypothetical protein